jgi:hypothetical protein
MNAAFPATDWAPTGGDVLLNSNASYSYEITIPPYAIQQPGGYYDHYQIKSTGISDRGQRVVYAITGVTNFFDAAVVVSEKIELKENSFIDGFDSNLGPYGFNGNELGWVVIGTTYAGHDYMVFLRNYVHVYGDVVVGQGGKVEEIIWDQANPGATTGPRYPRALPGIMDIIVPDCGPSLGDLTFSDPEVTIGTIGEITYFKYDNINIPNSCLLSLLGTVYLHVTGDIRLNNGSEIRVNGVPMDPTSWSTVTIYLDGDLNVGQGGLINNRTEKPRQFVLWGSGTSAQGENWNINNTGSYYGVYYGPNATIDVKQSATFYGSILGRNFNLAQSSQVHYDWDLSRINEADSGFDIDRWWEE